MNLIIQNLGRLQSGTFDLSKSLTIFVGRNNTSKTYVAHTIYALHKTVSTFFAKATRDIAAQKLATLGEASHYEVDVLDTVDPHLPSFIEGIARSLKAWLPSVFATDDLFFSTTQIDLLLSQGEEDQIRKRLLAAAVYVGFKTTDQQADLIKAPSSRMINLDSGPTKLAPELTPASGKPLLTTALSYGLEELLKSALLPGCLNPFILSTERSAIQLFSRELFGKRSQIVDAVLERPVGPDSVDQIKKETRQYPLAIRDELLFVNQMPRHKLQTSDLASLASRLEAMLGGAIVLDDSGDLMFQPTGLSRPLALHVSSSSVKSHAGLAFYLRHVATRGGMLVIDEPELNLHPDNQRHVARILVELARAGVRVLISTHSDYIIRELNNLIALHPPAAKGLREKYGYSDEETIDPSSVGGYLFDQTSVRPIDIRLTGIEVATIDNEINSLNSLTKDIYFALQAEPPSGE